MSLAIIEQAVNNSKEHPYNTLIEKEYVENAAKDKDMNLTDFLKYLEVNNNYLYVSSINVFNKLKEKKVMFIFKNKESKVWVLIASIKVIIIEM